PPWRADIVNLEALPQDGARALIESAFGAPVENALAETILGRTGGNPFFIEEVARGLRESDVLVEQDGKVAARPGFTPRVPATVPPDALGEALEFIYPERLDELVEDLAFHFGRSDNDDKARYWLVRAGDRARALYAHTEAVAQYLAALERARDGVGPLDAAAILERVGEVQTLVGRYDEALASLRSGVERLPAGQGEIAARLRRRMGSALLLK